MSIQTAPAEVDVLALSQAVACDVIGPDQPSYDVLRRVWNADIDRHPAAIVRCQSAIDVSAALTWCVANRVPITVRGGGHNLAGTSVADGAVLIDVGLMNQVEVDTDTGLIAVGAGCRWGDVDRAGEPYDITVPAGVVSHTGVAGLTLGGGFGYLARLFGATVDHVVEIEVVVADGRILRVDAERHPDLFWALKGAGHNYGIATRFVFRAVALPGEATIRQAIYPTADRRAILRHFRDWGVDAPTNVGTYVRLLRAPEYWSQLPAAHRGEPIISVATVYYGDEVAEPAVTAGMYEGWTPIWSTVRTVRHVTLQHATDDEFRYGLGHYWKHQFLADLPDRAIDVAIEYSDSYPGRALNSSAFIAHQVMCPFELIAGQRTPRDSSNDSTAGVLSLFSANIGADWEYPSEKDVLVAWAREFDDAMADFRGGTYINFTSVAGDEGVARAVYGDKYDRLVKVKAEYDPANVFARGLVDLSDNADDGTGESK